MAHDLGIKYSAGEKGVKATWTRKIEDWADVDAAVDDSYGSAITVEGDTFRIGVSTLPGRDWLVLKSVEIEMWEPTRPTAVDANGLPTCDQGAMLTMEYDTLTYEIVNVGQGEAYLSHTKSSSVQMITHANSALCWESAGGDPLGRDELPGFPVVMVNHAFQWQNIFDPPETSLLGALGKINSTAFLGHAIGTVLFDKYVVEYTMTSRNVKKYTLNLGCTARVIHGTPKDGGAITWNHMLRSDADVDAGENPWQLVVHKSGGASNTTVLHSTDLNQILTLFGYTHPVSKTASPPS